MTSTTTQGESIILGIELKGWYLLAKEGAPSFRYRVTPNACARQDLIVVVPWALNNVIAGSPSVFTPYIESALYAAEYRNYWWQHLRETTADTTIEYPANVSPYPAKSDHISDKPKSDAGGNFGRFARTGLMDDYLAKAKQELLCGISAEHWLRFFKIFTDLKETEQINQQIEQLGRRVSDFERSADKSKAEALRLILRGVQDLL